MPLDPSILDVEHGGKFDLNWRRHDHRFICCDCGSVHRLRFIVAGERMRIRAWNDEQYEKEKHNAS